MIHKETQGKYYYMQWCLEEYRDFVENCEKHIDEVFTLLIIFFDEESFFDTFAIGSGSNDGEKFVFIADIEREAKVVYGLVAVKENNKSTIVEKIKSKKGIEYLKIAMEKIMQEHMKRNFDEVFSDLNEQEKVNIEKNLKMISAMPDYLPFELKAKAIAMLFSGFFGGRDTEMCLEDYCIKVKYLIKFFNCSIFKGDILQAELEIDRRDTDNKTFKEKCSSHEGIEKLQEAIADKIFS